MSVFKESGRAVRCRPFSEAASSKRTGNGRKAARRVQFRDTRIGSFFSSGRENPSSSGVF